MIFDPPVLSLTEDAIGRIHLDADSLSAIWGVFTKCKDSLENGRRLENISWRLWWKSSRCERESEEGWSDPEEWAETTDDDSDQEESRGADLVAIPERIIATNQSHDTSPVRPSILRVSSDRRMPTMKGDSLQKMISGLKIDLLPPRTNSNTPTIITPTLSAIPPMVSAIHISPPPLVNLAIQSTSDSKITRNGTESNLNLSKPASFTSEMTRQLSNPSRSATSRPPTPKSPIQNRASSQRLSPVVLPIISRPTVIRRATSTVLETAQRAGVSMVRNLSSAPFEPQSLVKGFDTSTFLPGPLAGSVAPPPTPAPPKVARLGSPPPSAMKSSKKSSAAKKIFFISSPNSDSEDEHSSRSKDGRSASYRSSHSLQQPCSISQTVSSLPPKEIGDAADEQWDDDSQTSSGWGSDHSGQPESQRRSVKLGPPKLEVSDSLFARPNVSPNFESQLKPRPPGLLSQLFHPSLGLEDDVRSGIARNRSAVDVAAREASKRNSNALHTSKSAGLLSEKVRSKSFLRGAPVGTEMESSSEEDEDDDKFDTSSQQRNRQEEILIAQPQTPRSTRRSMLATELSASLRKNLLWERQTRNRIGVQFNNTATTTTTREANPPSASASSSDLRSRLPSQARAQPPIVRRHTTGQNLNKAGAFAELGSSASESSESEGEEIRIETRFGYPGGVHEHGW